MRNYRYLILIIILIVFIGRPAPSQSGLFRDSTGKEIRIDADPKRIIPLAPSLTEILYYLELGDRVAGVTAFSYYPPEAKEKPGVGSYMNLNVERIISLSPDLVIATKDGNSKEDVELLREAGIQVYVVNPRNVIEAVSTIEEIGNICGVSEKARQLVKGLKRRLDYIESVSGAGKRPLVFLQINLKPIMTVNKNTFHNDLIRLAGGVNMTADEPITYPRISIEEVIRKKPDIIIISSMERGGEFEKTREEWMKWKSIPAVKNDRVYLIDSDLIDRPSQRIIDGLEEMARLIHSEIDWNKAKDKND
jgi:iron complex transport system substrate-binding protein